MFSPLEGYSTIFLVVVFIAMSFVVVGGGGVGVCECVCLFCLLLLLLLMLSTILNPSTGFITERPDVDGKETWSDTGDRYVIKLFRDFVFHQVHDDGSPSMDFGHVVHMCVVRSTVGGQLFYGCCCFYGWLLHM